MVDEIENEGKLKIILEKHEKWLNNEPDGERANLKSANLESANLYSANLKSANLDFSCFPLWCGSFKMKVDERLIWQLIAHITRLDITGCNEETKTAIKAIWKYRNKFCKYRTDVEEI